MLLLSVSKGSQHSKYCFPRFANIEYPLEDYVFAPSWQSEIAIIFA